MPRHLERPVRARVRARVSRLGLGLVPAAPVIGTLGVAVILGAVRRSGLLNLETRLDDACFSPSFSTATQRSAPQVQVHPFNLSQLITQTRNPTAFCAVLAFYGDCPRPVRGPLLSSPLRPPSFVWL